MSHLHEKNKFVQYSIYSNKRLGYFLEYPLVWQGDNIYYIY